METIYKQQAPLSLTGIHGIQRQRIMELPDCWDTTTEARLTFNHEREEFEELMRQRRSAIVFDRSTMLQEIETKRVTRRRALDL